MLTREQLKERYDRIHEHFTFKDFLGLSALIFGLLMSNSSFEPGPTSATAQDEVPQKVEKPVEQKKTSKATPKKVRKKVLQIPPKKRQPITAAKSNY